MCCPTDQGDADEVADYDSWWRNRLLEPLYQLREEELSDMDCSIQTAGIKLHWATRPQEIRLLGNTDSEIA